MTVDRGRLRDAVAEVMVDHRYAGEVRYNEPTAAFLCTCGAEYEPWCLHVHQAGVVLKILKERGKVSNVEELRRERDDARGGYKVAVEAADRFRDVLAEALGHENENPGDDVLVRELREHFGRTGPEPRRWRDFCTGARAKVDQINAERRAPRDGR